MAVFKKLSNKTYLVVSFFLLISFLLVLSWFRQGHFYGGGDTGLPTYNPEKVFEMSKYIWWDSIAPGFLVPSDITSVPFYFFLSLFQKIGLSALGIQETLFFIFLFLMGIGAYFLILEIVGQEKKGLGVIGGLFYMFNPFMMVQVWHRFNHTAFVFAAAIPFLVLFWKSWIRDGSFLKLLIFLVINTLASYMFGTLAYVIPFWLILFLVAASDIFFPWVGGSLGMKKTLRFLLGFFLWIICDTWWLIPVLTIGSGVTSQQHDIGESLSTLIAISKQAIIPYSLQMINSYYIFTQAELGDIYKTFFFLLIPWIFVGIILWGMLYALKKKSFAPYVFIFLIVLLLAKGSSSPFGFPFVFLFDKFFILGLLRNPFEKMGILFPLTGSILFVFGVEAVFGWLSKYLGSRVRGVLLLIVLGVIGIYYGPMYKGTLFGKIGEPTYVDIPKSYNNADKWLQDRVKTENSTDGKILNLPLTRNDVITYNWTFGYHGIESAASLFPALPSISHGFNLKRSDDALTALSLIFNKPYNADQRQMLKMLQDFNVKFIILHKDIAWKGSDTYDPLETEKILNMLSFLRKEKEFGDLVIYELLPEVFKPKIVLSNSVNFAYPQEAPMRMWPYLSSNNTNDFMTPFNDNIQTLFNQSNLTIIFPSLAFNSLESSASGLDYVVNNLVFIRYSLLNTRVLANKDEEADVEKMITKIITANQDLVNIYIQLKNKNLTQIDFLANSYTQQINELFQEDLRKPKLSFYVSPAMIDNLFKLHLLILDQVITATNSPSSQVLIQAKDKIKQDLNSRKLLPLYPLQKRDQLTIQNRQINQFDTPVAGSYELLMNNLKIREIYPDNLTNINFQINDKDLALKADNKGDVISFGSIALGAGKQEISFENVLSNNLFPKFDSLNKVGDIKFPDQNTLQLSSDGSLPSYVESGLGYTEGEDLYQVSFEALIQTGTGFYIQILQDTDQVIENKVKPLINAAIYKNPQNNNWQTYSIKLSPLNLTTRQANFRIIVDPQGTTSFNESKGNEQTAVLIRNLQVQRILNNPIFLLRENNKSSSNPIPESLMFKQDSPVSYTGTVRIPEPTFLIFKEAFHPGWSLKLTKDTQVYRPAQHYIADLYGNAWWIDKPGEYSFQIEFEPQKKVTLGVWITILGGLVPVIMTICKRDKNERN